MRALTRTSTGILLTLISLVAAISSDGSLRASSPQTTLVQDRVLPIELATAADTEKLTYWVVLREKADLRSASAMSHESRGRFVVEQLRSVAARSQAGLRQFLKARGVDFQPFWAANVIKVTSDKLTLAIVARRLEVERIETDRAYTVPEPLPGIEQPAIQAVEWNIARVRAPEVWTTFGVRGEGIVVGSIDTGAQFTHPALVNQYRGNQGAGVFDHNYNWYDPSSVCGNPSLAPCDNNNHGTHTMGTIAGDDGGTNQIGVAPGVRWITAKGCESGSCSLTALVAAGQWMLAPTDLAGRNARPDLRPHIVSNSWGGASGNTFYQQIVRNWVAAGIVPVFANGNSGPSCSTANSPGDYAESYAVGAHDAANMAASFSSRGASAFGGVKPNISAPGVNVRSSIVGGTYAAYSGTSMATPHVAGVVALMWSAAPRLIGDIAATRAILDQTAVDTADTTCGGTAANNNVYGEGRMDAFAAVDLSPRGPIGTLQGVVTSAATGAPIAGAQVRTVGPSNRTSVTSAAGAYSFTVPTGSYDVTVSGFGYVTQTAYGLWVIEGASTVHNFAMAPLHSVTLSGRVRDAAGGALAFATVTIQDTPIPPAVADATGAYRFDSVPTGTYAIRADAARCNQPQTQTVALTATQQVDFTLPLRSDSFGYSCTVVPQAWFAASSALPLTGDDAAVQISLPFTFGFYGGRYTTATISTNGLLTFGTPSAPYNNTTIPTAALPNAAVYPLWDDLYLDASSAVLTATVGVTPNRQFVVEWRNAAFYGDLASRVDFQVALGESGQILMQYRNISGTNPREQGNSATVGIENASGTDAYQYSSSEAAISEGLSVRYATAAWTGVEGVVTDANDGLPIAAATIRAIQNNTELQRASTDASGYYRLVLAAGGYTIEASGTNYETKSSAANVANASTRQDFSLRTARVEVAPQSLSFAIAVGQSAQQTLTISNTGGLAAQWQLLESGGDVAWLAESPTTGSIAPGGRQLVQLSANAAGVAPGTYTATLLAQSNSARRPSIQVPVTLTVTQYDLKIDAGGPGYSSATGGLWLPDQAYTVSQWGFTNANSTTEQTRKAIASTADSGLYQTQRIDPGEYRLDGLTPGVYQVTVGFAEFRQLKAGARVVDVLAEGTVVLPAHDVMSHAGVFVADSHTFTISVTDGQLNLQFVPRPTSKPPFVNAIRIVRQ